MISSEREALVGEKVGCSYGTMEGKQDKGGFELTFGFLLQFKHVDGLGQVDPSNHR